MLNITVEKRYKIKIQDIKTGPDFGQNIKSLLELNITEEQYQEFKNNMLEALKKYK